MIPTIKPVVESLIRAHTTYDFDQNKTTIQKTKLSQFGVQVEKGERPAIAFSEANNQVIANVDFKELIPDPVSRERLKQIAYATQTILTTLIKRATIENSSDGDIRFLVADLNALLIERGLNTVDISEMIALGKQEERQIVNLTKQLKFVEALASNRSLQREKRPVQQPTTSRGCGWSGAIAGVLTIGLAAVAFCAKTYFKTL